LDALTKADTLRLCLAPPPPEPIASRNYDGDDDGDVNRSNQGSLPRAVALRVRCVRVQDAYFKAIAVLLRSFPRLLSVDVWQLCEAPSRPTTVLAPVLALRYTTHEKQASIHF
jgi:hypothetical protein